MKPVLFVTNHAPADRVGAFAALCELEHVQFALFGGRERHGTPPASERLPSQPLPFAAVHPRQRELYRMCASGDYRAVVCSTSGRLALPAAWAGARRARVPLILWSSLWSHPRTPVHVLSLLALARLYRSADAVVTYGPHVSEYVRARGARNVHIAPQAVDNAFWSAPATGTPEHPAWPAESKLHFLFVGRPAREKGLHVLLDAWRRVALDPLDASLVIVGTPPSARAGGGARLHQSPPGVVFVGPLEPAQLRNFYAASDVVVVPSIATPTFREPWGLVINEAFNQRLPALVTDAVGAAAGGLVRPDVNGLVVRAADADALAGAIGLLAADQQLRTRMGSAGAEAVRGYTYAAWAEGFSGAFASVGVARPLSSTGGLAGPPQGADSSADVGSFR